MKRVGFLALAIVLATSIVLRFGILDWLTLAYIQERVDLLVTFIHQRYWYAVILYIFSYIIVAALSIPIAALATITGGYLFGTVLGALFTNIGATIGATVIFLIVRYSIGEYIQERFAKQLMQFNQLFNQYGANFLLMARFIVLFPFFLVNMLAGLTRVSVGTFIWTTAVGILPASLVYSFAGRQFKEIKRVEDIFSWNVIMAFTGLALLLLIPVIARHLKKIRWAKYDAD